LGTSLTGKRRERCAMEAWKVLVKENDVAIIICPLCRKAKELSVTQYKERKKRDLRIKCGCGHIFCICLEYRRHPRKSVKMLGKSLNLSKHRESHDIIIKNISLGGIGFYTFKRHRIREDNLMYVLFDLNDARGTTIDARATVITASQDFVGCEFTSTKDFQTPLGFYLLS